MCYELYRRLTVPIVRHVFRGTDLLQSGQQLRIEESGKAQDCTARLDGFDDLFDLRGVC